MDNQLNFSDILKESTTSLTTGGSITIAGILVALSISLLCGLFIASVYRQCYQGVLFQKSYATTIVLVTLVTTMVIMVISGNLVLSLGMVGALSIVRFRAAIKDPLDIVYIFWAVGIGIANGVAYFSVSIISSIFIGLALLALTRIPSRPRSHLVIVNCQKEASSNIINKISSIGRKSILRSESVKGEICELVFEVQSFKNAHEYHEVNTIVGVEQVRIINYSANN